MAYIGVKMAVELERLRSGHNYLFSRVKSDEDIIVMVSRNSEVMESQDLRGESDSSDIYGGKDLILDISNISKINSSGIGSIIAIYTSAKRAGRQAVLCGKNDRIEKYFRITKLEGTIPRYDTLDEAVETIQKGRGGEKS
jgi:anti-sigma B factor antagonist